MAFENRLLKMNTLEQGTFDINSSKEAMEKLVKKNLRNYLKIFWEKQALKLYKSRISDQILEKWSNEKSKQK